LLVALAGLVAAIGLNSRVTLLLSLALVAVLSLSAWPVAHYGEQAYDRALAMADDAGAQYLEHHQALADRWIFLFYLTAVAAAASLVVGWKWPGHLRVAACVVALLVVASLMAGAVIAEYGGQVRHREFRFNPPPTKTQAGCELRSSPGMSGADRYFTSSISRAGSAGNGACGSV
jgi:hypothetical protein